jgi:hypothetical protein
LLDVVASESEKRRNLETELKDALSRFSEETDSFHKSTAQMEQRNRQLTADVKDCQNASARLSRCVSLAHANVTVPATTESCILVLRCCSVQFLCRELAGKADKAAIDAALLRKADAVDVAALQQAQAECARAAAAAQQKAGDAAAALALLQSHVQTEMAAVRQAADAASAAVAAALSSAAMRDGDYAPAAGLAGLQEGLAGLRDDLAELRSDMQAKADVAAINTVLQSKANKVTVAQALQQKVRASAALRRTCC